MQVKNSILVVDDCSYNIVAIKSLLQQFNLKRDICHNGQEAIDRVRARVESGDPGYNLIMMDFSMPECNGPTSTKAIRKLLA